MTTSEKLITELEKVLSGQPWYGPSIYEVFDRVTFDSAYEKPSHAAHNVAEILLHMLSWTEEVMDRLNGMSAGMPTSGDWPPVGAPDEKKWQDWIDDIKLANVNLVRTIRDLPEEQWDTPIDDKRGDEPVTTHAELVYGFIQHQIYHAGQIAILVKIVNG
ncbi:DinB family protein [Mucilaginibacter myungsuensis]|uniref:DinB family protein n=1 Tax=Mucilaginibacter myungsuensis TaxID=649104 RepID=A0A929L2L7_9SPHI|nr:DinB family protein [Mucilaginibacter myungsuensis]MBE9662086.1 DinB family protein [Mucilaginibacter myungsuensis]MDN3599480.1 DinB family protein [Mucilaginibacter myungsuensis]